MTLDCNHHISLKDEHNVCAACDIEILRRSTYHKIRPKLVEFPPCSHDARYKKFGDCMRCLGEMKFLFPKASKHKTWDGVSYAVVLIVAASALAIAFMVFR